MREIKFRAWDTKEKCWYRPTYRAYEGKLHDLLIGLSGDLNVRAMDFDRREYLEHESLFPNRYILNQWTGLQDRNGNEIYSGDIIEQHTDKCVIEPCIGGFDCKMIDGPHKGSTFVFAFLHKDHCEVIGNIHKAQEWPCTCGDCDGEHHGFAKGLPKASKTNK